MANTDRIGQSVGDYQLLRWLGGGGFGDVYFAEHGRTHNQIAIKVLNARLAQKEEWREFLNEARTIRLKHQHIIQLLDFGITEEDIPYLVMEYAANGTMRQRYPKGTRMTLPLVNSYITAMASALQYAHDQHLVHRDVKPENMLLGLNDIPLLSDFGIVTVAHSSHSINAAAGVGGTLPYMAPEQFNGKPRPASDQYALAIVAYEWLTGTRPFTGTPVEIAMQQSMKQPPSMRQVLPELPPEVEQVIFMALAKDPKARFGSVQAFANALSQASRPAQSTGTIPVVSSFNPPTPPPPVSDVIQQPSGPIAPIVAPQAAPAQAVHAQEPLALMKLSNEAVLDPPIFTERPSGGIQLDHNALTAPAASFTPASDTTTSASILSTEVAQPFTRPRTWTREKLILLISVIFFIIGSSGIIFTTATTLTMHAQATATAQQNTATVRAIPTVTAQARATAIAIAHATYTAQKAPYEQMASNGVMFGYDLAHTHVNPYEKLLGPSNVANLQSAWTFTTGSNLYSSPVVVNGVIYIGSFDDNVYAIDAITGKQKWAYATNYYIDSSPTVVNGVVYIGSWDHNLYAIDANSGTKKWSFQANRDIDSSPVVVNNVVYFGSYDGSVYAVDANSGVKRWSFATRDHIYPSSPAVVNGVVYIGSLDGNMYAIDANTGSQKWSFKTGNAIYSSPVVNNNTVYFGSDDDNLYAVDATSGAQKWSFKTGGYLYSSPAFLNGMVYFGSNDHYLYAVDAATGAKKWSFLTGGAVGYALTIANGVIYTGSDDSRVYALDARNGTQLWAFTTENTIRSSPIVANGMLYVGSYDHRLYAFSLPKGTF